MFINSAYHMMDQPLRPPATFDRNLDEVFQSLCSEFLFRLQELVVELLEFRFAFFQGHFVLFPIPLSNVVCSTADDAPYQLLE